MGMAFTHTHTPTDTRLSFTALLPFSNNRNIGMTTIRGRFCTVWAQRVHRAPLQVSFPVTTLTTYHRGTICPQGKNCRFRQQPGIFSVKNRPLSEFWN